MLKSVSKSCLNIFIIIIVIKKYSCKLNSHLSFDTIFHPSIACQLFICLCRKESFNGSEVYKTESFLLIGALHSSSHPELTFSGLSTEPCGCSLTQIKLTILLAATKMMVSGSWIRI